MSGRTVDYPDAQTGKIMSDQETAPGIHVGCAGWTLPKELATIHAMLGRSPAEQSRELLNPGADLTDPRLASNRNDGNSATEDLEDTARSGRRPPCHLTRYADLFPAVEINSSFYRLHRPSTYARWRSDTPAGFRFAVKLPRLLTHEQKLALDPMLLDEFFRGVIELGEKLGCVLVQLPPSLRWDAGVAVPFLQSLRERTTVDIVCEPRHRSWFEDGVTDLLRNMQIGRVAADPACVPSAAVPGGDERVVYYRWHGSPRMYYSEYGLSRLRELCQLLTAAQESADRRIWCIFDNTAAGAALLNAAQLQSLLRKTPAFAMPSLVGQSH